VQPLAFHTAEYAARPRARGRDGRDARTFGNPTEWNTLAQASTEMCGLTIADGAKFLLPVGWVVLAVSAARESSGRDS